MAKRLWRDHRRALIAAGVATLFLLGGGIALAYELLKPPADISNPNATFRPQKPKVQKRKTVAWPQYGYDRARTRYLPAKGIRPPFRKVWRYTDKPLLEFCLLYTSPSPRDRTRSR